MAFDMLFTPKEFWLESALPMNPDGDFMDRMVIATNLHSINKFAQKVISS